ncbi:NUDIX hydrolase [Halocatena marina]|uniref:NUDIX hydrolase n=1 Tax=Halocatena marina TaxID=2934937 RepID=UPI00222411F1|nr:NUDIX hydrolase [Halocatena marina]
MGKNACPTCTVHIFHVPCPCAGVAVRKEATVLLIQRASPPYQGTWALPGGVIEYGESPDEAATRELREESNLTVSPTDLTLTSTRGWNDEVDDPYDVSTVRVCFGVSRVQTTGEPKAGADVQAVRFWSPEEIEAELQPGELTQIQQAMQQVEH